MKKALKNTAKNTIKGAAKRAGRPPSRNSRLSQIKVIKRYGNRKLYDTEQSVYVVLDDIAKMIRNRENIQIIDNATENDITHATLTQIIFGAEQKAATPASLDILKSIIKEGDGSFSSFLAKIGLGGPAAGRRKARSSAQGKKQRASSIGERVAFSMKKGVSGEGAGIPHLPGNGLRHR